MGGAIISTFKTYTGIMDVVFSEQELADFYDGELELDVLTNQYVIVRNSEKIIVDKLRWDGDGYKRIKYPSINGFKSKSFKQDCLMDLLLNHEIPIKLVCGCAGSGKTLCAIAAGMDFLKKGKFNRIFVVRQEVPVGEKIGFLPGNKTEKILNWLGFFKDNLFISNSQFTLEEMIDNGTIEVDSVSFLKGRSIANSFVIIDEAEDLTESQLKMIGERVSENSIICFVGDINQVTQMKYAKDSGLKRAIDNLKGNPLVGVVVFDDNDGDNCRSDASRVFTSIY